MFNALNSLLIFAEPKIVNRFPADYKDEVVDKELPKFCFPYDLGRYSVKFITT